MYEISKKNALKVNKMQNLLVEKYKTNYSYKFHSNFKLYSKKFVKSLYFRRSEPSFGARKPILKKTPFPWGHADNFYCDLAPAKEKKSFGT